MSRKRKKGGGEGGGGGGGHDGGGSLRWLLTYADMITLLMAFFIMMYSMSVLNLSKFNELAFSIRSGFGGVLKGGSRLLMHPSGQRSVQMPTPLAEERSLSHASMTVQTYAAQEEISEEVKVTRDQRGVVIHIAAENLLFERGTATMTPRAAKVLQDLAGMLQQLPNDVLVEGHTCSAPISTTAYPSNWELSAARACRVVRYLQERRVPTYRLTAVGYGESRPIVPNTTEANRSRNRRVDIVILDSKSNATSRQLYPGFSPNAEHEAEETLSSIKPRLPKVWKQDARGGWE